MRWPAAGHVTDLPFARLFGGLATDRHTGVLRLEQDTRVYAVSFKDGEIVDAASSAPEDTIGRVALDAGLVDAATVGESIRRMAREKNKTQRDVLIEMKALRSEDGARLARMALTRRSLRLFALAGAGYTLDESQPVLDDGGPVEARWVLYRGLRQHYDERRLERELGELGGKAVRLPSDSDAALAPFGFSDEERIVAAYLQKGYWDLGDLVEACLTLPRASVLAVVLSLLGGGGGILDVQPAGSVPRVRKRAREATIKLPQQAAPAAPPTRPQPPSQPVKPISQPSPPVARPAPSQPVKPISQPSPPVARAAPTAPPTGRAPSQQVPAVKPISQPVPAVRPGTMPPLASSSGDHGVIATGEGVVQVIRDKIAAKFAQIEADADHFAILELDRAADSSQIKTAYLHLARTYHPDRLALVKLESLRPQVDRIFARLSDAHSVLKDDASRQAYLRVLAEGGEAAVKRRENDETELATRVLTAEEHFRKGEMAMRRENMALAEKEFQAALDLNDQEAEHHALLAWARWCNAPDKDSIFAETKKAFNRAIELNSRCAPAYLHFGDVYLARGEHDRAYGMFQRVLDIEEHHVIAQRQVRLIEMRRAKGQKKGLFDMFKKKT